MASQKSSPTIHYHLSCQQPQGYFLVKFYSAFFFGCLFLSIWRYGIPSSLISPINLELDQYPPLDTEWNSWRWDDIEPTEDLIWSSCYKNFKCARLSLPLDWLNLSNTARIFLAIIKIPATDLSDYRGPVFTNPGGPGGSGIFSMRRNGHNLQKIVGKNYDIIAFDPRGVGASTPRIDCWGSKLNSKVWNLQSVGVVDSHPGVLYDAYARAGALSRTCADTMNRAAAAGEESLLNFVSTASVARDMLEIMHKAGETKMRYWGFSYGTFLGGVFAAMYPEKVERLVSDGNVDYQEWSTNTHTSFLRDADKIMEAFYHYCQASGTTGCSFYSPTTTEMANRLSHILSNLKVHPIIVPSTDPTSVPEIITYTSLKRLITSAFYRPVLIFPSLANVLLSLEAGDGAPFIDLISTFGMRTPFTCDCESCHNDLPSDADMNLEGTDDAMAAVMCGDGGEMNDTPEEFAVYAENLIAGAQATGAVNVEFRMACVDWKVKPKFRFTGPFAGNTSHPILYIANQADNVTPVCSAVANAEGFPGSIILVQESYGHTSLTAPSLCTARHINTYFQTGVLPAENTRCKPDVEPFGRVVDATAHNGEGARDLEMREAGLELMRNMDAGDFRFRYGV